MAKNQPLRIFFGNFMTLGNLYADFAGLGSDHRYPDFLTGLKISADIYMHHRLPLQYDVTDWDEYLDIRAAAMEQSKPNVLQRFVRHEGVEDFVAWKEENDTYLQLPANTIAIETYLNEFMFPTRMLSKPYPKPGIDMPQAMWLPTDQVNHAGYTYDEVWRLYVTLWDAGLTIESSPQYLEVGELSTGPIAHVIRINNPNTFVCKYSIYKAQTGDGLFGGRFLKDWPLAITAHHQVGAIAPGGFVDLTFIVRSAATTAGVRAALPALNDARARVKFDYDYKHRISPTTHQFLQRWLILNGENHEYFIGLVEACSDVFYNGYGKRGDDQGHIVLRRLEQGLWVDDAWTDPNNTDNFKRLYP